MVFAWLLLSILNHSFIFAADNRNSLSSQSSSKESEAQEETFGLKPETTYTINQLKEHPYIAQNSLAMWVLNTATLGGGALHGIHTIDGREAIDWARRSLNKGDYRRYLEREAAREQRSEREKESALELAIEQNRFSLHRQQQEHMAGLNRELWVSNIKTTFSGIKDVMNDKKGLATVGSAVVGVVSAITGIYFTAKYGIPKLFAKKKPRIVNETSLPENIQEWLFGKTIPASRHSEMVYSNDLEDNIFHLIESFKKAIRMKRPISNLLFWGMPGTGKSMAAKEIARHSGAEYIGMSGADLFQLPIEEALQELKNLHQFSKKSKKPVIIFVDEAEAIFPSRENASENTQKITDSFLGLIDKPSDQKVAWIFATNHPKKIDTAVLSRVSKRGIIHFTLPDFDARVKLITLYMNKTFIAPYAASCELKNGLSLIAAKTENWSGRDIEQLMIDTLAEADQMQSAEATLEDVFRVISRFDANQF